MITNDFYDTLNDSERAFQTLSKLPTVGILFKSFAKTSKELKKLSENVNDGVAAAEPKIETISTVLTAINFGVKGSVIGTKEAVYGSERQIEAFDRAIEHDTNLADQVLSGDVQNYY